MLRRLFEDARRLAPSVVFMDEFQAVFSDESSQGSGLSSALVSCLDDITDWNANSGPNAVVTIIAATNEPWAIHKSFLRPGRLERRMYVGPLDNEGKTEMLMQFIRKIETQKSDGGIPLEDVIASTVNFTGADMDLLLRRVSLRLLDSKAPFDADTIGEILRRCISEQKASVSLNTLGQYDKWLKNG